MTKCFLKRSNRNQRLLLEQLLDTRISKHNCYKLNMRLCFGSAVSSKLSSYYSKRTKSILLQYGCFWLSDFVNIYYCFFNKPVYSCKDTTGKSGDEDSRNSTASRKKKRKFVEFALTA